MPVFLFYHKCETVIAPMFVFPWQLSDCYILNSQFPRPSVCTNCISRFKVDILSNRLFPTITDECCEVQHNSKGKDVCDHTIILNILLTLYNDRHYHLFKSAREMISLPDSPSYGLYTHTYTHTYTRAHTHWGRCRGRV